MAVKKKNTKKPTIDLYSNFLGNLYIWSNERILAIELSDKGVFEKLTVLDCSRSAKTFEKSPMSQEDFFHSALAVLPDARVIISSFFDIKKND